MRAAIRAICYCLAGAGLIFCLAPFFYAYGFCFPRGDDFDEITRAMFLFDLPGGIYEICREWLYWSGRYTYHFLAVFLARSAQSTILAGITCASILLLYALAACWLARMRGAAWHGALIFGGAAILAVLATWLYPESFYILTDALTIILQGGLFLLFLASLCQFWRDADTMPTKKDWLRTLLLGIVAIGVYEHSALAVFWTTAAALILTFFIPAQKNAASEKMAACAQRRKCIFRLLCWFCLALAFSFLAPGNFQRNLSRGTSPELQWRQLCAVPDDFISALASFGLGCWVPVLLCLILLFIALSHKEDDTPQPVLPFTVVALAAFAALGISIIGVHALSDVPFDQSAKFTSSFNLYAAIALGFALFFPLRRCLARLLPAMSRLMPLPALLLCFFCIQTTNFQGTAINAVNGTLLMAGQFLEQRYAYLHELARQAGSAAKLPPFGLMGEIRHPGVRKRTVEPGLPAAIVAAGVLPVFPVFLFHRLAPEVDGWPNLWAAWVYGLGSIKAVDPAPGPAAQAVLDGIAPELALPAEFHQKGIHQAWRLQTRGANPTFATDWIVVKAAEGAPDITFLRPNPVMPGRLAPQWLQKKMLGCLLQKQSTGTGIKARLAATLMAPLRQQVRDLRVYRCGMAMPAAHPWPQAIFASINGKDYQCLRFYAQ